MLPQIVAEDLFAKEPEMLGLPHYLEIYIDDPAHILYDLPHQLQGTVRHCFD
jgi:hypothetical protein